jgi:undecaprenyl-diphosphatase
MAIAKGFRGFVVNNDMRLMRRCHHWRAPLWLRLMTTWTTRLGDGWVWYALALILLLFGGKHRFVVVAAGVVAALAGILVFRSLKGISKRPRPCQIEPHCWAAIMPPDRFSFPSGHAMTAFSVAVSIGHYYPELQILLLFLAVCIAASRIILGMHFLTDVIAGSAIGVLLGTASLVLVMRW